MKQTIITALLALVCNNEKGTDYQQEDRRNFLQK